MCNCIAFLLQLMIFRLQHLTYILIQFFRGLLPTQLSQTGKLSPTMGYF